MSATADSSIDPREVERFDALADSWWDADGAMGPLHRLNPVRLTYLRARLCDHFQRPEDDIRPLSGLSILDIGCGGGLLAEPLTRLGGQVTAIDAAADAVAVALAHARQSDLAIDYACTTTAALVAENRRFDAVIASEVVEHVADVPQFLNDCAALVNSRGIFALSTLNRTLRSLLTAKLAAEYILGWLPRGTHDWHRFRTPDEIARHLAGTGLSVADRCGMSYEPMRDEWRLSDDLGVNYWILATR